ncbi:MAG: 23S rRNA (guanosine(2251)-2'-O)-methyltransferase RlmB [Candidatus Cloacimonetes bacterium]|nr:23S rRNA (guanosine(2251)-2'-O)-methyltransferase RlmB [Candidatus Cloacimonadota bacterium]
MQNRLIYGKNPVAEALVANHLIEVFAMTSNDKTAKELLHKIRMAKIPLQMVDRHILGNMAQTGQHQGFVAYAEPLQNASLNRICSDKPKGVRVLLLSNIQDPGNLGAVIRNCEHFGIDLLVIGSKGSCDWQLPSVSKASAGAVEHQKIVYTSRPEKVMEELKEKGFSIYGLEADVRDCVTSIKAGADANLCMVLGSEGEGISLAVESRVDQLLSIPRNGLVNSLNVSAASVVASMWLRGLI